MISDKDKRIMELEQRLVTEVSDLENVIRDNEFYKKAVNDVVETAKGYGLISDSVLWSDLNDYENKRIDYDQLYKRLLDNALQELKMAVSNL